MNETMEEVLSLLKKQMAAATLISTYGGMAPFAEYDFEITNITT